MSDDIIKLFQENIFTFRAQKNSAYNDNIKIINNSTHDIDFTSIASSVLLSDQNAFNMHYHNQDSLVYVTDEIRFHKNQAIKLIDHYNGIIFSLDGEAFKDNSELEHFIGNNFESYITTCGQSNGVSRIKKFIALDQENITDENPNITYLIEDVFMIAEYMCGKKLLLPRLNRSIDIKVKKSRFKHLCRIRIADFEQMLLRCTFNFEKACREICILEN